MSFDPPDYYNIKKKIEELVQSKWNKVKNTETHITWMRHTNKRKVSVIKKGKLWNVYGSYKEKGNWESAIQDIARRVLLASEHTREDAIKEAKRIMETIDKHAP